MRWPRQAPVACGGDGFDDLAFAASPGDRGALDQVLLDRSLIAWLGLVVLAPLREFVGVVEDRAAIEAATGLTVDQIVLPPGHDQIDRLRNSSVPVIERSERS